MKKRQFTLGKAVVYLIVTLFALFCLLPMLLVVITSFTKESAILRNGYSFFPTEWSVEAYRILFAKPKNILQSYGVTVGVTIIGTLISVIITYMAGFALANQNFRYRYGFALFFYITTIFGAGIVPQYLIIRNLGMYDTIWALIIPGCFSPFNMFLVRNFINGIPYSLYESATIDGAGILNICRKIYFPICQPVIATITLFYGIGYWNSYYNSLMFTDSSSLQTLQMMSQMAAGVVRNPPTEGLKMATAVVTIGPIILLYPLLQKYFIKGIVVGAVKG